MAATTAVSASSPAPITATVAIPFAYAVLAASITGSASCLGSSSAVASAPLRVELAASPVPAGKSPGRAATTSRRYTALAMLPRTAMPRAPPSSVPVSFSAAAAPAFCGGAVAITRL